MLLLVLLGATQRGAYPEELRVGDSGASAAPTCASLARAARGGDWVGTCVSAEDSARACAGRVAAAHESGDVGGEEDVDEAAQLGLDASERVRHVLRHFGKAQLEPSGLGK